MNVFPKALLILAAGGLVGLGFALWSSFGGAVYAAALTGAWGACF